MKSILYQDSISSKNRLFFASGRILVGIGRTHIATNTHASILPARASAYRVRLHWWSWSRDWHAPCLHRPFLDRLNGSPGLPGHPCNRFFIVWIIDFIAPGQSSKNPKMVLIRFILVLNLLLIATGKTFICACHSFTWITGPRLHRTHRVTWSLQTAYNRLCYFLLAFYQTPKTRINRLNLIQSQNYQCVFADKTGQKQSCELPELHQNLHFWQSWLW